MHKSFSFNQGKVRSTHLNFYQQLHSDHMNDKQIQKIHNNDAPKNGKSDKHTSKFLSTIINTLQLHSDHMNDKETHKYIIRENKEAFQTIPETHL